METLRTIRLWLAAKGLDRIGGYGIWSRIAGDLDELCSLIGQNVEDE